MSIVESRVNTDTVAAFAAMAGESLAALAREQVADIFSDCLSDPTVSKEDILTAATAAANDVLRLDDFRYPASGYGVSDMARIALATAWLDAVRRAMRDIKAG